MIYKRFDHEAILELYNNVTGVSDENGTIIARDSNGNIVDIDHALVEQRKALLENDWNNKQYQRDRRYPPIGEQLDMLWHGMNNDETKRIEPFYSNIKLIKDTHPKT